MLFRSVTKEGTTENENRDRRYKLQKWNSLQFRNLVALDRFDQNLEQSHRVLCCYAFCHWNVIQQNIGSEQNKDPERPVEPDRPFNSFISVNSGDQRIYVVWN